MSKRRLSEQFREQLGSLGESLAKHTRSLESHFEGQEQLLIERQHALAKEQQQLLLGSSDEGDDVALQQLLSPFLKGDFNLMVVGDLRKFCTSQGIRKVSKLRKQELLQLLNEKDIEPPLLPVDKVLKKLKRADLEKIVSYFVSSIL
jgi:uncharacterized protein YaaW (UPF0174 family)